jgi:hypothetical protein
LQGAAMESGVAKIITNWEAYPESKLSIRLGYDNTYQIHRNQAKQNLKQIGFLWMREIYLY